jgi:transcriptional regulator with XRE-family HTH domain
MLIDIVDVRDLGLVTRATRKLQKLRLDDAAGSAGVGHVFVRDLERGKPTVQLGRVLRVLAELGIALKADMPESAHPLLQELARVGLKPPKPRRSTAKSAKQKVMARPKTKHAHPVAVVPPTTAPQASKPRKTPSVARR